MVPISVRLHLDKSPETEQFELEARAGGSIDAWLDLKLNGSHAVELFVPWDRCAPVGETLIRAGVRMLELAREKEAEKCESPTDS